MRVCKVLNMLLFAVLIISCTEIKTTSKWEPNLQNEAVDSIGYSLFVDSIEYVYLETNDSCLIRSITDIVVSNNRLFVFDEPQQTIWVFDREGKYIKTRSHTDGFRRNNANYWNKREICRFYLYSSIIWFCPVLEELGK